MLVVYDNKAESALRDVIPNDHALLSDLYPLTFPGIFQKNILQDIH